MSKEVKKAVKKEKKSEVKKEVTAYVVGPFIYSIAEFGERAEEKAQAKASSRGLKVEIV